VLDAVRAALMGPADGFFDAGAHRHRAAAVPQPYFRSGLAVPGAIAVTGVFWNDLPLDPWGSRPAPATISDLESSTLLLNERRAPVASIANDQFQTLLHRKDLEMIPAFYREEDALTDNPGVLRALVSILAEQAVVLRRSSDRLGTTSSSPVRLLGGPVLADWWRPGGIDQRARPAHRLAKTIYYRRRKGTPRVLGS